MQSAVIALFEHVVRNVFVSANVVLCVALQCLGDVVFYTTPSFVAETLSEQRVLGGTFGAKAVGSACASEDGRHCVHIDNYIGDLLEQHLMLHNVLSMFLQRALHEILQTLHRVLQIVGFVGKRTVHQ